MTYLQSGRLSSLPISLWVGQRQETHRCLPLTACIGGVLCVVAGRGASEEGRPPAFQGLKWLHGQWSSFFTSTRPKWNNRRRLASDAGAPCGINELFWEPAGSKRRYIHIGMKLGRLRDRSSPGMDLHMNCLLSASHSRGGWWCKAKRCRGEYWSKIIWCNILIDAAGLWRFFLTLQMCRYDKWDIITTLDQDKWLHCHHLIHFQWWSQQCGRDSRTACNMTLAVLDVEVVQRLFALRSSHLRPSPFCMETQNVSKHNVAISGCGACWLARLLGR